MLYYASIKHEKRLLENQIDFYTDVLFQSKTEIEATNKC